mmetsp:Transcript_651/g.2200  ORF Transcript_651/g.2200 Transcript_651/m.2200 type:complete len:399 (+) Transcript_651:1471-2667(+)
MRPGEGLLDRNEVRAVPEQLEAAVDVRLHDVLPGVRRQDALEVLLRLFQSRRPVGQHPRGGLAQALVSRELHTTLDLGHLVVHDAVPQLAQDAHLHVQLPSPGPQLVHLRAMHLVSVRAVQRAADGSQVDRVQELRAHGRDRRLRIRVLLPPASEHLQPVNRSVVGLRAVGQKPLAGLVEARGLGGVDGSGHGALVVREQHIPQRPEVRALRLQLLGPLLQGLDVGRLQLRALRPGEGALHRGNVRRLEQRLDLALERLAPLRGRPRRRPLAVKPVQLRLEVGARLGARLHLLAIHVLLDVVQVLHLEVDLGGGDVLRRLDAQGVGYRDGLGQLVVVIDLGRSRDPFLHGADVLQARGADPEGRHEARPVGQDPPRAISAEAGGVDLAQDGGDVRGLL